MFGVSNKNDKEKAKRRGNERARGLKRRKRIPQRERFGLDKSEHTHTVTGGGGEGAQRERESEREEKDEERTKRRSIGPQRGTGSSTPVSTAWPLPALGIPNPVITQNTQGLTGSLSQHCFPLGGSGLCGMCRVYSSPFPPEARKKPLSRTCHLDQFVFYRFYPKAKKNLLTCSGLSRRSV